MSFREYAAFFQPHELDALNSAYNAAWEQMATESMNAAEASDLRNRLAQMILASACNGERDAKRLEQIAVRALSPRRNRGQFEAQQC